LTSGVCEPYVGTACSNFVGHDYVFIPDGLTQSHIEQRLMSDFAVIAKSKDLSSSCSNYAIPAICVSAFPPCDRQNEKPRKLCREECEILHEKLCRTEIVIARQYILLGKDFDLPQCEQLPPIGSPHAANCIQIGVTQVSQLLLPHSCYTNYGREYRGTISTSRTGVPCLPWNQKSSINTISYNELIGGHNFCRNPEIQDSGVEDFEEPWCYSAQDPSFKETCGIPKCSNFNIYLYIVVPAIISMAIFGLCVGFCCMRQNSRRQKANQSKNSTRNLTASSQATLTNKSFGQNLQAVEMNSLLKNSENSLNRGDPGKSKVREFHISHIRFIEELGEGAFGKVYKGECLGVMSPNSKTLVAIKTLKPGANVKTRNDFQREAELMAELRHPNIVCLIGVAFHGDPQCMIFEHMALGDLHEFLISHSPVIDSSVSGSVFNESTTRVLKPTEMSLIAIQIASGMEYLSGHHYVHRDLAARNCLVGENLIVKISDFGLSRDIYAVDYYRVQSKSLLPVRWMPPESILYGKFTTESDVWSFGVVLWEIFSYGLQPYYGYTNQEVIEMIRSRQLLPCPEDCPSRIYAFMVECWHEVPTRRPNFAEIHTRLCHWEGYAFQTESVSASHLPSHSHHSSSHQSSYFGSVHTSSSPGARRWPQ